MIIQSDRIGALDFVKGVLVLFMVVYHVLNYLQYETVPHEYLGFVPASFIMIAGFLVTSVYAGRQGYRFPDVAARLGIRAAKLLVLFTVLNLLARMVHESNHYGATLSVESYLQDWMGVYIRGDAQAVAFDVLVPIAYTMALSILVLALREVRSDLVAPLVSLGLVAVALLNVQGAAPPNVNWLAAGMLGMALGGVSLPSVDRALCSWKVVLALLLAYGAIVMLRIDNLASQLLVTVAWLLGLYITGQRVPPSAGWVEKIWLLGHYSLLAYIVQIAFLQGTSSLTALLPERGPLQATLLCLVIAFLTWGTAVAVDCARHRVARVDRLYRFVFA